MPRTLPNDGNCGRGGIPSSLVSSAGAGLLFELPNQPLFAGGLLCCSERFGPSAPIDSAAVPTISGSPPKLTRTDLFFFKPPSADADDTSEASLGGTLESRPCPPGEACFRADLAGDADRAIGSCFRPAVRSDVRRSAILTDLDGLSEAWRI